MKSVAFRVLCLGSVAAALIGACSSGDETAVDPATTSSGNGASSNVGNGSGATGTGGMEVPCPHEGPDILDPSTLMPCPMCAGGAHCVPSSLVPPENLDQLADCDADNKCVPDDFIKTGGNFIPETCTSIAGNEGRCLSECLGQIQAQANLLPKDTCPDFMKCAPCYDPITSMETGACSLSCDPGPTKPAIPLPGCCDGLGTCVPKALVPPDQAANLPQDTCPMDANDYVCAPTAFITDPNYVPPMCTANLPILGDMEGACIPKCLATGFQGSLLEQKTCAANHVCAPCNDPLSGDPTGVCPP